MTGLACLWFQWGSLREPGYITDFDQLYAAAKITSEGRDTYAAFRDSPTPALDPKTKGVFYPLTAMVIVRPLTRLQLSVARVLWIAAGAFAFTYLILRTYGYTHIPAVMSGAFLMAVSLGQTSPFVAAALLSPWFGWVLAAKPNFGACVVVCARWLGDRRAMMFAGALAVVTLVASLLWRPSWPWEWRAAFRGDVGYFPRYVTQLGGVLMLLPLLRWRRPEARWLASLSCITLTPGTYDVLMLWAFPMSFRESLMLGILSHIPNFVVFRDHYPTYRAYLDRYAMLTLLCVYLPAVAAILMRPNVADGETSHHGSEVQRPDS